MHSALPEAEILLVLHPDYISFWTETCHIHSFSVPVTIVHGGETRSQSVRNALMMAECTAYSEVYVHDGARPLADISVVCPVAEALSSGSPAAIPAIPVTDSLRRTIGDNRSEAVDRSSYVAVQTPQGFRGDIISRAYAEADTATDDATLVQSVFPDIPITITQGAPYNIKITSPHDIAVAETLINLRSNRI